MSSEDSEDFRIRQAPTGRRKPLPGPDIEAKILDAAEFVFGHFGFRGATTALIAKKASIAKPTTMTDAIRPVVTRAGQEDRGTGQSGGALRISGVSPQHTPATRLWFGKVSNDPGYRSLPHHHGEAETGGYVLRGRARIYFGEGYAEHIDMAEGDFVFVPPFMPHVEVNMSLTEDLVWLTARTPDNIVVNFDDVPDGSLAGFRRAGA